jgi:hypothetical protein
VWQLMEKDDGEVVPIPRDTEFLLLATMTAESGSSVRGHDLSPALYNRFCVVYMTDVGLPVMGEPADTAATRGRQEAAEMLKVVSGGQLTSPTALAAALMDLKLGKALDATRRAINIGLEDSVNASVTVRTIATVADCFYSLQAVGRRTGKDFDATFASLQAALLQPLKVKSVRDRVKAFLEARLEAVWPAQPDFVTIVAMEAKEAGRGGTTRPASRVPASPLVSRGVDATPSFETCRVCPVVFGTRRPRHSCVVCPGPCQRPGTVQLRNGDRAGAADPPRGSA